MSFWSQKRNRGNDTNYIDDETETDNHYDERLPLHINNDNDETDRTENNNYNDDEVRRHSMMSITSRNVDSPNWEGRRDSMISITSRNEDLFNGDGRRDSMVAVSDHDNRRGSMMSITSRNEDLPNGNCRRDSMNAVSDHGNRRDSMMSITSRNEDLPNGDGRRDSMVAVSDHGNRRGSMMTITSRNDADDDVQSIYYNNNNNIERFNNSFNSLTSYNPDETENGIMDGDYNEAEKSPTRQQIRERTGIAIPDDEFEKWKKLRQRAEANDENRRGIGCPGIGFGINAILATQKIITMIDKATEDDDDNDKAAILLGRNEGSGAPQPPR
jgi:hypothetical protein